MSVDLTEVLRERDRLFAFLRLEERYRGLGSEERAGIRAGWPFGRKWRIPGFEGSWDEMVFAPLQGPDRQGLDPEARIEARLSYHSIENARSDFRDNAVDLILCWPPGQGGPFDKVDGPANLSFLVPVEAYELIRTVPL